MSESFAKKHPKVVKFLNKLEDKITEEEMQKMNYDVNVNKKSPADVAKEYLLNNGLLKN